ncbi:MAG: hypothetical protein JO031_09485, partial [Ktedonobacteraceae bacterium]|nr:hypothetical protein [Ktedonobacteraceae bacterium]
MQLLKKKQRTTYTLPFHLFIGLLAIAILYSGCDTIASSASSPSSAALSTSSAAPTKPPETKTEAKVRAALARVNQLMQGMTLDEELGQMLMVEYVGSDYNNTNTELHGMITDGHIGGYLYQSVNGNFAAPADTIAGVDNVASQ